MISFSIVCWFASAVDVRDKNGAGLTLAAVDGDEDRSTGMRETEQDESAASGVPLITTRELWASGFNARENSTGLIASQDVPIWMWTDETVDVMHALYDKVMNPEDCVAKPVIVAEKGFWGGAPVGMASRVRDFEDLLIHGLLTGTLVLHKGSGCADEDPFLLCEFEPFSRCQGRRDVGAEEAYARYNTFGGHGAIFTHNVEGLWSRLQGAGLRARKWAVQDGVATPALDDVKENPFQVGAHLYGVRQLGVVRALLADVAFRPSAPVAHRVTELEAALRPAPPMLVLQVRRTDKLSDDGWFPAWFANASAVDGLRGVKALVQYAERLAGRPYASFYLIADDPAFFSDAAVQALQGAFAKHPAALFNPFISERFGGDAAWRRQGHAGKGSAEHRDLDVELAADMEFAARHGSHLVGCGRSGISQFIAQRIGARNKMDPNAFALFEDDRSVLKKAMGEKDAAIQSAFIEDVLASMTK